MSKQVNASRFAMLINTLYVLMIVYLFSGCGPISAHSSIARAHIAIEAAEGARANNLAIFEFESAKLYLRKAKLEEGLSSFQSAIDLAILAEKYANSARARARENAQVKPKTPAELRRLRMLPQNNLPQSPSQNISPNGMTQPNQPNQPNQLNQPQPTAPMPMPQLPSSNDSVSPAQGGR